MSHQNTGLTMAFKTPRPYNDTCVLDVLTLAAELAAHLDVVGVTPDRQQFRSDDPPARLLAARVAHQLSARAESISKLLSHGDSFVRSHALEETATASRITASVPQDVAQKVLSIRRNLREQLMLLADLELSVSRQAVPGAPITTHPGKES